MWRVRRRRRFRAFARFREICLLIFCVCLKVLNCWCECMSYDFGFGFWCKFCVWVCWEWFDDGWRWWIVLSYFWVRRFLIIRRSVRFWVCWWFVIYLCVCFVWVCLFFDLVCILCCFVCCFFLKYFLYCCFRRRRSVSRFAARALFLRFLIKFLVRLRGWLIVWCWLVLFVDVLVVSCVWCCVLIDGLLLCVWVMCGVWVNANRLRRLIVFFDWIECRSSVRRSFIFCLIFLVVVCWFGKIC